MTTIPHGRAMNLSKYSGLIVLFLLVCGGYIAAQTDRDKPSVRLQMEDRKAVRDYRPDDLALVRALIGRGAHISAANLLEDMYAADPGNTEVINLLLNCYFELKAYQKAEILLQRQLEAFPFAFQYHARLLDVYLKIGVDSLIDSQIKNTLEKFPGNPDIYRSIVKKLTRFGYDDQALNMIKLGRQEFENDLLFALESASLHEIKGSYYDAVMEYFKSISDDTLTLPKVDRKMASLIRFPGAPPDVINALRDLLDTLPDNTYALKRLQEAYILNNQLAEAFEITMSLDSLTKSNGVELFIYMRQCRERKLYDQVIKIAEYIDERGFDEHPFADYKFYYAEALVELGMYSEAISNYDDIVKGHKHGRDKADALLQIGNVYRYHLLNYDSARLYYDSVATFYLIDPANTSAWLEIAALYLVESKLDSAKAVFEYLKRKLQSTEQKELVAYNLAMIQFYQKEFNDADLAFRKIIVDYPRGFYVNDALINSLIIGDCLLLFPEVLSGYADALSFETRLMPDSVEARLKAIIEMGETPLIGLSMYKLADFYVRLTDTAHALATIDEMEKQYSDNYFYPYSLKLRGDIFLNSDDSKEKASGIYRNLLENYNSYPFVGEIREKLQKMETYQPSS